MILGPDLRLVPGLRFFPEIGLETQRRTAFREVLRKRHLPVPEASAMSTVVVPSLQQQSLVVNERVGIPATCMRAAAAAAL